MKEKVNVTVDFLGKHVFKKQYIIGLIVIFLLVFGLRTGYEAMFEVEGAIQKIDEGNVTVANFFVTRTVDLSNFENALEDLEVGDYITVQKNLSGTVIAVGNYSDHWDDRHDRGFDDDDQHDD